MAIDKIFPGRLDTDTDERLIEKGYMTDALNISIAEDGKGTASVVKNIKGTIPGVALNAADQIPNNKRVVGVGSASDPQRGYIYFIVADVDPSGAEDAIYQYNVSNDTYRLVFKDSRLNLDPSYFVKIDVVNGDFERDGSVQSILFFTDNVNPPRKIHVERAFSGAYNNLIDDHFDYSINTIKAAPAIPPSATFTTDQSIDTNNFKEDAFQFATQLVYASGEESAISPYSSLVIPTQLTYFNIDESGFGLASTEDNVCKVSLNLDATLKTSPDIAVVRLLARTGNTSNFHVVDEFDPNSVKTRNINGGTYVVYDGLEYKFFNDKLGTIIPDFETNKLFDNVPFQARGQAVSGNRLMYSNYTEGRPNVEVDASLTAVYGKSESAIVNLINEANIPSYFGLPTGNGGAISPFEFTLNIQQLMTGSDFVDVANVDTVIPAATLFSISFDFLPQFEGLVESFSDQINDIICKGEFASDFQPTLSPNQFQHFFAAKRLSIFPSITNFDVSPFVSIEYTTPTDITVGELVVFLSEVIDNTTKSYRYELQIADNGFQGDANNFAAIPDSGVFGDGELPTGYQDEHIVIEPTSSQEVSLKYRFNTTVNGGEIIVTPTVEKISVVATSGLSNTGLSDVGDGLSGSNLGYNVLSSQSDFLNANQIGGGVAFNGFTPTGFVQNQSITAQLVTSVQGFKAGSLHNLRVVYSDKYNRSGFANDIGTVYAEWYNSEFRGDQSDPTNFNDGTVAIEVDFQSPPPSWAEYFHIVYPGNTNVSEFTQYTVGGAYPERVGELIEGDATTNATRDIDLNSKRLYISLETLDQYREKKSTTRQYNFTPGDRLRVVSYDALPFPNGGTNTGTGNYSASDDDLIRVYPGASDKTVIEFDVVGEVLLTNDVENPIAYGSISNFSIVDDTTTGSFPRQFVGRFLIVEASSIAAGAVGQNGEQLRYPGFDWNHVGNYYKDTTDTQDSEQNFEYPLGNIPSVTNNWENKCVVEVYTPKKSTDNQFFYEIAASKRIDQNAPTPSEQHGGAILITNGDIHFRPIPCRVPKYIQGAGFNTGSPKNWEFQTKVVEDFTVSEKSNEKIWSRGRVHVSFENAATFRRFNGVTYSDAYAEDVDKLSLTSFNATLANFYSLDSQYGSCNYIANYGSEQRGFDELVAIQENKFSKTPVNKSIITDAANQNNVALSTNVLVTTTYYSGDYGCGNHPESVLVQDNDVYFFDRSRKKVVRFAGGQLTPISDQGVSSLINQETDAFNLVFGRSEGKIVSGYDPQEDVYYLTFVAGQNLSWDGDSTPTDDDDEVDEDVIIPEKVPLYRNPDIDGSGVVGTGDLLLLLGFFGTDVDTSTLEYVQSGVNQFTQSPSSFVDFNLDGLVGVADLLFLLAYFNNEVFGVSNQSTDDQGNPTEYLSVSTSTPQPITVNGQTLYWQPAYGNVDAHLVYGDGTPVSQGVGGPGISNSTELHTAISNLNLVSESLREQASRYLEEFGYYGFTISYNARSRFWQSRNSFYPDVYANQDNAMYSLKYVKDSSITIGSQGEALLLHKHSDNLGGSNRCQFYNQPTSQQIIDVVSNDTPSAVKVYDAISHEGQEDVFSVVVTSSDGSYSIIQSSDFDRREGTSYASLGRDESPTSSTHVRYLGLVTDLINLPPPSNSILTINQMPSGAINGATLKYYQGGQFIDLGVGGGEVYIDGDIAISGEDILVVVSSQVTNDVVGQAVVMETPSALNGDSVRGHYAKIRLSSNSNVKYELYCVNAHVTLSNLNHV